MKTINQMNLIINNNTLRQKVASELRIVILLFIVLLAVNSAWGQSQKSTKSLTQYHFAEDLKFDEKGCYWEVTFDWSCTQDNSTNPMQYSLPHGIRITIGGATINTTPTPTMSMAGGSWSNDNVTILTSGNTVATWSHSPIGSNIAVVCPGTGPLPASIIPYSPAILTIKIYITPIFSSNLSITVDDLDGFGNPANQDTKSEALPSAIASPADGSICKGKSTFVNLIPPVPAPAKIKWYTYTPQNCGDPCIGPPTTAPINWTAPIGQWVPMVTNPPQLGANTVPTNPLSQTTCYVAYIEDRCFHYWSTVARVNVCEPLTGLSITANPALVPINGTNHACDSWSGNLSFNYNTLCCPTTTIVWTESIDGGTPVVLTQFTGTSATGLVLPGPLAPQCCKKYTFTATVTNACGSQPVSYTIYIDRKITKNDVTLTGNEWDDPATQPTTLTPLGPICYNQSARVKATPTCTGPPCEGINILKWEELKWTAQGATPSITDPNWTPITGALGTPLYFTNKLKPPSPPICTIQSIWYRVSIKNGACPPVLSNPYEIQVKPELSVTLASTSTQLCPPVNSITLTATPCYSLGVQYEWFLNGQSISQTTVPSLNISQPGYYYVEAIDADCGTKAKSNVIKICGKPVVLIKGPCVACQGQVFTMNAIVSAEPPGCGTNCPFTWSTSDGSIIAGANTATVTANSPGTYTVSANCNNCIATSSITVGPCPTTSNCNCYSWSDPKVIKLIAGGAVTSINCGGNGAIFTGLHDIIGPTYICNPSTCNPTYQWEVSGPSSGNGTGNTFQFDFSPSGVYVIKITPFCGGVECDPCTITIKVEKCKCKVWNDPKVFNLITSSGVATSIVCNGNATILSGLFSIVGPTFICDPSTCNPTYEWEVSGTGNGSGTGNTFTYDFNIGGTYVIKLTPFCGGVKCPPCIIKIEVIKISPWMHLIMEGGLKSEKDPVNIALNAARQRFAGTQFGIDIENWYADLNSNNAIPVMLSKHLSDVKALFTMLRRLKEQDGTLNKEDLVLIERTMRMMDREIAPAPTGLIDESMKRLKSSLGQKWPAIIVNLSKK